MNEVSTNQAILNKLDDVPTSAIDVLENDLPTLKAHFNSSPESIKSWSALSGLSGAREWTRKSIPLLQKMEGNTDDLMKKVKQYYSTHQKPKNTGAPPFVHQGVKSCDVDPRVPFFIDPLNKVVVNKLSGSIISGFGGSICLDSTDLNHKSTFKNYLIDRNFILWETENKMEGLKNEKQIVAEFDDLDRLNSLKGL